MDNNLNKFKDVLFSMFNRDKIKKVSLIGNRINIEGDLELIDQNMAPFETLLSSTPRLYLGTVLGNVDIKVNGVFHLIGSPRVVKGNFDCSHNQIHYLKGSPGEITGDFNCSYNRLINIKGCTPKIGGSLIVRHNNLINIETKARIVNGIDHRDNPGSKYFKVSYNKK